MKIFCVGKNYLKHVHEMGDSNPPESPVIFIKPDTSLFSDSQYFYIPDFTQDLQYEVEIVLKVSKRGKCIQPQFVEDYYQEIALGIDFTARDIQHDLKNKGLPWEKSKAFDNAAFVSQFVPKEDYENIQDINFSLKKNDKIVQKDNTSNMIWKVEQLICHISEYFTLQKGDLIYTGTPSGVGKIMSGDKIEGKLEDKSMFCLKAK